MIIKKENHTNAFMVVCVIFSSMFPIVHFIISIGIAFCLETKHKRKYTVILLLGLIGMMPDLDHLFSIYNYTRVFHNTLFLGVIPLVALAFAQYRESYRETGSSTYQRFFIGVAIVLLGHLLLDLIAGHEISLGLTSSPIIFGVPLIPLLQSETYGTLISSVGMLWLLLFIMVLSGNIAIKKVYALNEGFDIEFGPVANIDNMPNIS